MYFVFILFVAWNESVHVFYFYFTFGHIIVYMYVDNINFQNVVEIHGIIGYYGGQKCCIEFLNKFFWSTRLLSKKSGKKNPQWEDQAVNQI